MEPEDTRDNIGDLEEASDAPQESFSSTVEQARAALASGLNRRKFLAAAALGSAAAALVQKAGPGLSGVRIGALPGFAQTVNCNAGDIDASGGTAINEPCTCTGTFTPQFAFLVSNQNNANRTCITLFLGTPAAGNDSECAVLNGARLLLRVAPGQPNAGQSFLQGRQTNVVMVGTPVDANGNPIQIDCNFTQCCFNQSVIGFRTSNNQQQTDCAAPLNFGDFAPAQCRFVNICLTGFGIEVECASGSCAPRALTNGCCSVACGASLNVKISASGSTAPACTTPLTLSVKRPGATTFTTIMLNASGCYVDPSPVAGTYTFRVTDCHGCSRDATLNVCLEAITKPTVTAGTPNCAGVTTFAVAPCPPETGVTYTLVQVDCATGLPVATPTITNVSYNAATCTFTATLPLGATTCVRVKASNTNAACDQLSDMVSVVVPAQVAVTLDVTGEEACNNGRLTFTATPSGGVGPYTVTFKKDGVTIPSTGNTAIVSPVLVNGGLDTACHRITVEVQDSRGCPTTPASASITYQQCVNTTLGCTIP